MAAVLFHEPVFATVVESGDLLYFYEVGTTTSLTVYTDFALTTPASQPVAADSNGRFVPLYIDATGNDPKVVLEDSGGNEKWTCPRYPVEDITTLSSDLDTAEANITSLDGRLTTAESDIDTLQTESADYETRITTLEGVSGNVVTSDFTGSNQSLGSSGYQKLPGGVIMQWGVTTSIALDATTTVTLPTAFTSTNYQVMATGLKAPALGRGAKFTTYNFTTTTFDIGNDDEADQARWFAIGN